MSEDGFGLVFSGPVARHSILVAIVVGTVLNVINQGDNLIAGEFNWLKAGLTYVVPFCVASYGAHIGSKANR